MFLLLFSIFFFQITTYKYIYDLSHISTAFNFFLTIFLITYFFISFVSKKTNKKVFFVYLIPGLLMFGGMSLNFIVNFYYNPNILSQYGLVLPWIFFIIMPYILKDNLKLKAPIWRWYYFLIIWALTISIIEFYAVTSGSLPTQQIDIPNGRFQAGFFSIFHVVDDEIVKAVDKGLIHARLYGPFSEPMSLVMFSLPAFIYGFFHGRYIGCSRTYTFKH